MQAVILVTYAHLDHNEGAMSDLSVLDELGEAQLEMVLDVQVEEVVGNLLGRWLQEGDQHRHHLPGASRSGGHWRRGDRVVHAACTTSHSKRIR